MQVTWTLIGLGLAMVMAMAMVTSLKIATEQTRTSSRIKNRLRSLAGLKRKRRHQSQQRSMPHLEVITDRYRDE